MILNRLFEFFMFLNLQNKRSILLQYEISRDKKYVVNFLIYSSRHTIVSVE